MTKSMLVLSISMALGTLPASAQDNSDDSIQHSVDLERIVVKALPYQRSALESAQPIDVLAGEALDDRRGMTLGETLSSQPGVHSSYYGPGAGRPIIRGMGGPRVRILEDGLSTGDASAPSDDHAVSLDPMLIDQIEILRGPATLLYGSGASGGVVNVIDNRIPEQMPSTPIQGRFDIRGDTVADERSGVLRLDGGGGNFAWHFDGTWRDADDYRIPVEAERDFDGHDNGDDNHDDEHENEGSGRLNNSFVENRSGTIGASWIGQRGFVGVSYRQFETEYGIPAPHGHGDDEHDDDFEDNHDGEDGHEDEEEEFAFIDMKQQSWDMKAGMTDPAPGFTRATLRLGFNDYVHREIEMEAEHGDGHDDEPEHEHEPTTFDVESWQARLELETEPVMGFAGAVGLQVDSEDFQAIGEEAFVAPNETDSVALFVLQERQFGDVTLSLGGRVERHKVKAELDRHDDDDYDDDHDDNRDDNRDDDHDHDDDAIDVDFDRDSRNFTNWSASVGAIWQLSELWHSRLNLSRSERAPSAAELFSNGPHLATFSFEIGNPDLNSETTIAWDLGLHRHSERFDLDVNLFHKKVDDFIYLADTGLEADGFAVRQAIQQDAEFYGLEAQGVWQLHATAVGDFDFRLGYDLVHGKLDAGGNLPRISPERLSSGIDWHAGPWRAGVEWQRVFRQDRVADFETPTPGYNLINATVGYSFTLGQMPMEAYLSGHNLGDNEARVHTSFLRDFAPLPGRNFRAGLRGRF